MDLLPIVLRILHVVFSFLWIGLALVVTLAIGPAMMGLGLPERKAFQLQFLPRQMFFAAVAAFATVLTGLGLLGAVYGGSTGVGFANDRGYWIILGSLLGIGAFSIALAVLVPTGNKILAILKGEGGDPSQMPVLVAKMGKMAPIILFHMLGAASAMLAAAHGLGFNVLNLVAVFGSGLGFGLAMLVLSRRIQA